MKNKKKVKNEEKRGAPSSSSGRAGAQAAGGVNTGYFGHRETEIRDQETVMNVIVDDGCVGAQVVASG